MIEIATFVERYNAVWNEPDANRRRRSVSELWSENARHFTETLEAHGCDAIEARIIGTFDKYVATGEFTFKTLGNAIYHHNVVKYNWEMVPQVGGLAAAVGTVFIFMGEDGRILADYQFTDVLSQPKEEVN